MLKTIVSTMGIVVVVIVTAAVIIVQMIVVKIVMHHLMQLLHLIITTMFYPHMKVQVKRKRRNLRRRSPNVKELNFLQQKKQY